LKQNWRGREHGQARADHGPLFFLTGNVFMELIIVEIKKSSRSQSWYQNKIGESFIARRIRNGYMLCTKKDEIVSPTIEAEDCEEIGEVLVPNEFVN
jgi:hypothetical protein